MESKRWLKQAAALTMAAAAGGLARSRYERDRFVLEETIIASPKIKKPKVFVFLSDLHDKEFGAGNRRLLDAVESLHPDAALVGGDTMVAKEGKCSLEATGRLLAGLAQVCPVYYGNGNHEQRMRREAVRFRGRYQEFLGILRRYKVVYLSGRSSIFGEDIRISGLDIGRQYYYKFAAADMSPGYVARRLGAADTQRFQILLAHSPLFFDAYAGWGADLSLAGHFHGGTVRLPFLGGVMTPQYHFFLPCCAGAFEKDGRWMVVSRGLGTHSINIRFGNLPQVAVLRLRPDGITEG